MKKIPVTIFKNLLKFSFLLSISVATVLPQWERIHSGAFCFSHDGNFLICSSSIFEYGQEKEKLLGYFGFENIINDETYTHEFDFSSIAESSDGKYIAGLDKQNIIRVFEKHGLKKISEFSSAIQESNNVKLFFSGDGSSLILFDYPKMYMYTANTGAIEIQKDNVTALSENGTFAVLNINGQTGIIDIKTGKTDTLSISPGGLNNMNTALSVDGSLLIYSSSVSGKIFINLYDIKNNKFLSTIDPGTNYIIDLKISENKKSVIFVSQNSILKIFDSGNGALKDSIELIGFIEGGLMSTSNFEKIAWKRRPDFGCPIGMPDMSYKITVMDLSGKEVLRNIPDSHNEPVYFLAIDPKNKFIASGCNDRITYIRDFATGKALGLIHETGVMAFVNNSNELVISEGNKLKIFDTGKFSMKRTIVLNTEFIQGLMSHPEKQILICIAQGKLFFISTYDYTVINTIDRELNPLRFSSHYDRLICISGDSALLYDSESGIYVGSYYVKPNSTKKFGLWDVSPDLKYVAGITSNTQYGGNFEVWDLAASKLVLQTGQLSKELYFLPDSRYIAIHSADPVMVNHSISAVKLEDNKTVCYDKWGSWETLLGSEISSLKYSADGYYYAIGWCDGNVSVTKFCGDMKLPVDELGTNGISSGFQLMDDDNYIRINYKNEICISENSNIEIFDIFGKKVNPSICASTEDDNMIIDINKHTLPNGVYFLTIFGTSGSKSMKFINYR